MHLPGKKELRRDSEAYEVVIFDVTETSIKRPKRITQILLRKKEKAYNKEPDCSGQKEQENTLYHIANGRKRFCLRLNLIAAIYNLELKN